MWLDHPYLAALDLQVFFISMKGICLNCNGLGADNKRSWVKDLIESESLIFFGIQETKIDVVDSPLICSLWPRSFIDFAFCSSHGASGGILTMWDSRIFSIDSKFENRNFLGVVGTWMGINVKVGLLNIYAPQSPSLKDQLWSDMENLINAIDAVWIIFGDFNVVRCYDERFGCLFDISEANSFNDFISRVGLFVFPLGGRRFTRFDKNGSKASKLDRFLVSGNFLDYWTDASVSLLSRSISDHCPLLLKVGSPSFGPKPYRIFDKWIGNEEFKGVITNSWASSQPPLSADLVLKNKLKKLRLDIKTWTTNQMLSQNKVKEDLKKQLLEWDVRAENGLINDLDVAKRGEWIMDLNHLDQIHRNDLKQKSRIRWAVEGDENTRFFHSLLKFNNSKSNIKGININGVWCEDPDPIKRAALEHFSARFKEGIQNRPFFCSSLFHTLSSSDYAFLDSPFSLDEVKGAVWGCEGSKAPGPDGFNFNFVKTYWNTIKSDFWDCIINFESSGHIANGCNPSFIVLIPKKLDSLGFSDYRPISLIGCVYKVISKILANKLAKVIPSIINPNQSAFIAGRKILDGCLIANEIIRMASIENLQLLIFKVDFEKAFDSVNWNFLLDIMRQMGFSSKWRKWMFSCLSSASISVIVNGSPTKEFRSERGIRQGDPLSPFLFLIVAEALQVTILEACEKGVYSGLRLVESGSNLSLLQYADDALFFGEWSRANASNLIHILFCFELALGLNVNIAKSRILGIGVPNCEVENLASSIGCYYDSLPFSYLGLSVGKRLRSCSGWSDIINRFRDRLSSWKAKSLSIGGRLTLVKSILGSLPIYYLSLFRAPLKVINILESIRRRDGSLLAKNMAFLGKWKWRFLVEKNALWRTVIKDFYGIDGGFGSPYNSFGLGGIWCDIIKSVADISHTDPSVNNSFALKVSSGLVTSFWVDPWCPNGPILKNVYPRLFALETQKDCKVADRWKFFNGIWVWKGDASGSLKVKSLSKSIQNLLLASDIIDKHSLWNSWIHRKVNICMLRASLDRLTTRINLSYRGVVLPSSNCPLCLNAPEDIDHCIVRCPCSISIWRKVWSWWNLSTPVIFPSFSIADIAAGRIKIQGCNIRINKILQGVLYCVVWSIWNWRNKIVMRILITWIGSLETKTSSPLFKGSLKPGSRRALSLSILAGAAGPPGLLTSCLTCNIFSGWIWALIILVFLCFVALF
ncbi:putative RNA-directed DNA polymerase [Tanacetum coccineum]